MGNNIKRKARRANLKGKPKNRANPDQNETDKAHANFRRVGEKNIVKSARRIGI